MDKFSFVKDGVTSKLPPGFRFQPTDKEIVFQYLARKIFSYPLPASIIPEITISSSGPWSFPTGDSDQDRYFFINKANYGNWNRILIPTSAGFWRAIGPEKRIVCSKTMPLVGIKKTLVFYEGKNTRGTRTDWIMHEYYVTVLPAAACTIQQKKKISPLQGSLVPIGNWVLCHLSMKKTSDHRGKIDYSTAGLGSYSSSSSSSSSNSSMDSGSSSILTEVSSDIVSNDETNDQ